MSLVTLELPMETAQLVPQRVIDLLTDGSSRIDQFIQEHKDNPAVSFVPSDYELVYRALNRLHNGSGLLPGNAFCEWGSGLGVIACLAAIIGYDSVGIEIDQRLVTASQSLARDHRINVELVHGSFVPEGHSAPDNLGDSHIMTIDDGRAAYDEIGLDPDDFDCVFAYPWPGDDELIASIFDQHAARGAVLVTFHGQDGIMARRKR
ncbi:MAG: hypothetical protein L0Y44_12545 [Phycisphaerales bacterium]|nr:hypothetical protein [Phycisphaerales bacterium]MCI0631471.1 hypothetical protein [Phycisphaerales bacterium]MCI0675456.1 hypothetical protein [Phycisphaerales bacterium]